MALDTERPSNTSGSTARIDEHIFPGIGPHLDLEIGDQGSDFYMHATLPMDVTPAEIAGLYRSLIDGLESGEGWLARKVSFTPEARIRIIERLQIELKEIEAQLGD